MQNIKYIVQPVRNPRVKVSTNVFTRRAPKLNYAKANQRWWIQIDCNSDIDLYILEKALKGSEIRLVELEEKFYIEDPRIRDTAEMGDVHRAAETIIAQLNAATRILCPPFGGAQIESIAELYGNGTGACSIHCDVAIHGTESLPAITAFLHGPEAPINVILPALKSNGDVQEALFYLGADGNVWANLYKATEVVEDHAGGGKAVVANGFCTRTAWERFRRTANHQEAIGRFSRHARSQAEPPPDPMTEREARLFVGELVKKWIDALTAEQNQKA
jgi:hypothetical protein